MALAELIYAFPNQGVEKMTIDVYLKNLLDLPPEAVAAACERLAKTAEMFPSIAKIRSAVDDYLDEQAREKVKPLAIGNDSCAPPSEEQKANVRRMIDDLSKKMDWPTQEILRWKRERGINW